MHRRRNNSMQRTVPRVAADAERYTFEGLDEHYPVGYW